MHRAKRIFDMFGALTGLIILSPFMVLATLGILFTLGRPILFKQIRPGFRGKPFTIYKFRTMIPPKPGESWFRTDNRRLSRLGIFLRQVSLDELPELWNVLKGDMSLVGPRPLLMEYLEKYTEEEKRRHEMLPGITGLAQIRGRQHIPFSKRLELDIWYVEHWSLFLDVQIILKTLINVYKRTGVVSGQNIDDVDDIGLLSEIECESKSSKKK